MHLERGSYEQQCCRARTLPSAADQLSNGILVLRLRAKCIRREKLPKERLAIVTCYSKTLKPSAAVNLAATLSDRQRTAEHIVHHCPRYTRERLSVAIQHRLLSREPTTSLHQIILSRDGAERLTTTEIPGIPKKFLQQTARFIKARNRPAEPD
ncbi:hypothetical protein EDB85DRAFT_2006037 [Lactarius pseudohatsudake]|nr:hypothetical protein EDB85DRAFT_2006037 [Lactarius pseudohatsudake]